MVLTLDSWHSRSLVEVVCDIFCGYWTATLALQADKEQTPNTDSPGEAPVAVSNANATGIGLVANATAVGVANATAGRTASKAPYAKRTSARKSKPPVAEEEPATPTDITKAVSHTLQIMLAMAFLRCMHRFMVDDTTLSWCQCRQTSSSAHDHMLHVGSPTRTKGL